MMDAATKTTCGAFCAVAALAMLAGAVAHGTNWVSDAMAGANGTSKFSITISASLYDVCWGGTSFVTSGFTAGCWKLTSNTVADNSGTPFPFGAIFKNFDSSIQTLANASAITVGGIAVAIAFATLFVFCMACLGFKAGTFSDAAPLVCMRIAGFVFWVSGFASMWVYLNGLLQMSKDMTYYLGTDSSGQTVSGQGMDATALATGFWLAVGAAATSIVACCCGCVLQEADVVKNSALPLALRGGKGVDTHTDSSASADGGADGSQTPTGTATSDPMSSLPVAVRVSTEEAAQYGAPSAPQSAAAAQRLGQHGSFAIQVPGTPYVVGLHPQGLQITRLDYYNSNSSASLRGGASGGAGGDGAVGAGGKTVELITPTPPTATGHGYGHGQSTASSHLTTSSTAASSVTTVAVGSSASASNGRRSSGTGTGAARRGSGVSPTAANESKYDRD